MDVTTNEYDRPPPDSLFDDDCMEVEWKKGQGIQTKTWHHSVELLTVNITHVSKYSLPDWDWSYNHDN